MFTKPKASRFCSLELSSTNSVFLRRVLLVEYIAVWRLNEEQPEKRVVIDHTKVTVGERGKSTWFQLVTMVLYYLMEVFEKTRLMTNCFLDNIRPDDSSSSYEAFPSQAIR